jgi:hypothetical protein
MKEHYPEEHRNVRALNYSENIPGARIMKRIRYAKCFDTKGHRHSWVYAFPRPAEANA